MRVIASLLLAGLLAACATPTMTLIDGTARIDPSSFPGATHRVAFINREAIGFNADRAGDRHQYTRDLLKGRNCADPQMLREEAFEWGTWGLGSPRITYYSDWKC